MRWDLQSDRAAELTTAEQAAAAIFAEALTGCDVDRALREIVPPGTAAGAWDAAKVRRLLVIAMGKGAARMLEALFRRDDLVGERRVAGVLVATQKPMSLPEGIRFFPGAHPSPARSSFDAAQAILQMLKGEPASEETLCVFLISGGASAMVELPWAEEIGVAETVELYRELVLSGAPIQEINCVRKHFSRVKGGRLAQAARHLSQLTLLMSDVPENEVDALASGPTLADRSTMAECRAVLETYGLRPRLPVAVTRFFDEEMEETPKPGEVPGSAVMLLSPTDLERAASRAAARREYTVVIDCECDGVDYRRTAEMLLERFRELRREAERVCLISVGEALVQVPWMYGDAMGGRNQHTALYLATRLEERDRGMAMLSCGSDGVDGNSVAAGAVVSLEMRDGMEPEAWERTSGDALREFRSFRFLQSLGRTIETGPTGLNLRDLRILLADV